MTPDIFFSLNKTDLNLYYQNTFMRARLPDKEKLAWIAVKEFQTNAAGKINVFYRTGSADMCIVDLDKIYWDFSIPETGVYNYKNSVMVVSRNPTRQTIKGLCSRHTNISNLMLLVALSKAIPAEFYTSNEFEYNSEGLNLLFENTENPLSFEKGVTKILKKQSLAFAINSRISISQGIISKHPSLWLKNRLIGEVDIDKEVIYPIHTAFVPELNNTFLDKGFTVNYES